MKKHKSIFILIFLLFLFFVFFLFGLKMASQTTYGQVEFPEKIEIVVEKALNKKQKQQGLSFREAILDSSGMLFVYEKPEIVSLWMKDMLFAIDMVWIVNNKIVHIVEHAQPETDKKNLPLYSFNDPIDFVLEVNAGFVQKYGIQEGDRVNIVY